MSIGGSQTPWINFLSLLEFCHFLNTFLLKTPSLAISVCWITANLPAFTHKKIVVDFVIFSTATATLNYTQAFATKPGNTDIALLACGSPRIQWHLAEGNLDSKGPGNFEMFYFRYFSFVSAKEKQYCSFCNNQLEMWDAEHF